MFENAGSDMLTKKIENLPNGDPAERIQYEILKTINSLPEALQTELEKAKFEGVKYADQKGYDEEEPLTIMGLEEALNTATNAEAIFGFDKNYRVIELKYSNSETETEVRIKGMSDGINLTRPILDISYKDERYSWAK